MTDITKTSGEQQKWASGAQRDISTGKPRYDLIPLKALRQWAELMERGARHYSARNWEKGIPTSRFAESALRHFFQYMEGDRSERHLAGALFNIGAMIHFEGDPVWDDINNDLSDIDEDDVYVAGPNFPEQDTDELPEFLDDPDPEFVIGGWEQLSFDFDGGDGYAVPMTKHDRADEGRSYINWDSLTKAVDEGRADAEEIAWPEGHPYRKVNLRKKA